MKRLQLAKQLGRLRGALKSGEGTIHISKAAEKVRLAALAVIKARLALIAEFPQKDPDGRFAQNLGRQRERWLSYSIEAIIDEHGKADPSPSKSAPG